MRPDRELRVLLVAEELSSTPDEGVIHTLERLCSHLNERYQFRALFGRGEAPEGCPAERVRFTRMGITPELWRSVRAWRPGLVLYSPSASITLNALYRASWLRRAARCKVAVMGFQRRNFGPVDRALAGLFEPDTIIVTSNDAGRALRGRGWSIVRADLGVDLVRFCRVSPEERRASRESLGWTADRTVVLHVGHLRAGRGLDTLVNLARAGRHRVVMVASVSERGEEHLAEELVAAGIELHQAFIKDIERYYQAADLYLFPVRDHSSAIDFPLSVLEALACGLPVLSTRFGALPERFDGSGGLSWLGETTPVEDAVDDCLTQESDPRRLVESFGWSHVLDRLMTDIQGALE